MIVTFYGKREFELWLRSWKGEIIFLTRWVQCNHKGPNKSQAEGDLAQKTMWLAKQEAILLAFNIGGWDHEPKDVGNAVLKAGKKK